MTVDTGPSYHTQRQEASEALTQLAQANPQLMQVAGDIVVRSFDFPMAEELAKRLEKTLPPNLKEQEGQPELPPEVQQHIEMLGQQVQQLGQALEKASEHAEQLESGAEEKTKELLIKAYEAETKRLQVLGTAMQPEQVQALVMQTLQEVFSTPAPASGIEEEMQEHEQAEMMHMQQQMQPEMQEMPPDPPPDMGMDQQPPQGGFFTPETQP